MLLKHENNRIYSTDDSGHLLAEITFPSISDGIVDIDHTYVAPSLQNRGIADSLVRAAVAQMREQNCKTTATCSYAKHWFENHPEYADVLHH